jgi:hypothetical protein
VFTHGRISTDTWWAERTRPLSRRFGPVIPSSRIAIASTFGPLGPTNSSSIRSQNVAQFSTRLLLTMMLFELRVTPQGSGLKRISPGQHTWAHTRRFCRISDNEWPAPGAIISSVRKQDSRTHIVITASAFHRARAMSLFQCDVWKRSLISEADSTSSRRFAARRATPIFRALLTVDGPCTRHGWVDVEYRKFRLTSEGISSSCDVGGGRYGWRGSRVCQGPPLQTRFLPAAGRAV